MTRHCRLGALLAAAAFATPVRAQDPAWDPTVPRGRTRTIAFTTTEGTWMSADISPDGRWIVFDLLGHVYRVPATGGEAVALTQNSGIALNYHPRYSPDGRTIAFVSDRRGQDNLWAMDADGSNPRPVLLDDDSRAIEPNWMPDGKTIVFTRRMKTPSGFYRTNDEIWTVPAAGGTPKLVVRLAASGSSVPARAGVWAGQDRVQWPSPTPDGRYLYFHSSLFAGVGRQLKRIELGTGRIDDVTENKDGYLTCCGRPAYPSRLGEIAPEVSPDGRWLAFARKIPGARTAVKDQPYAARTALWLRDLATGREQVLMDPITSDQMDLHPAWEHRVLPGYAWARDGRSLVLAQGGKLRRVWLDGRTDGRMGGRADGQTGGRADERMDGRADEGTDGRTTVRPSARPSVRPSEPRVETIPFTARVERTISEMARHRGRIEDGPFLARYLRWPTGTPDGRSVVFEAAGRLWRAALPAGAPTRLVTPGPGDEDGPFELTPATSPDGRWVAFVTWDDLEGGHLWRVASSGGRAERLTTTPGRYLYPEWTGDGAALVVNRWAPELSYTATGSGWEVLRIPAAGGAPAVVRGPGSLARSAFDLSGRIYRMAGEKLIAVRPGPIDPWTHPAVAGSTALVRPSPDGRWAAIALKYDVYLAPLPAAAADSFEIDLSPANRAVRRLTLEGGEHPRWRSPTVLELVSGSRYLAHDAARNVTDTTPISLAIDRPIGRGTIALTNAKIVTMENRRVVPRGSIVVRDGRIACVGACNTATASRRVDLAGKTVIPGLVDVHAHHLTEEATGLVDRHRSSSARYLAWGVTTTHDPANDPSIGFSIGEMVEAGRIVGPRTFSTGIPLTCTVHDDLREIETFEDARQHLVRAAGYGAISIKDYKQCTRIQRQMLAQAARDRGVTITSEGADLLYLLGLIMNGSTGWEHPIQTHPIYSDVARFFGQAGAHYSAQLFISDYPFGNAIEHWLGEEDLWRNGKVLDWTPWQRVASRRSFVKKPLEEFILPIAAQTAAAIKRAGGRLAVGAHGEQDGLGSHWELWSFGLGMEPIEALEAATIDPAHFLGLERDIGSIAVGKIADLVILDADPLADLRNTVAIRQVMKQGRLFDARTLDQIWPAAKPYGPHPWNPPEIFRQDLRADDYWDRRTRLVP